MQAMSPFGRYINFTATRQAMTPFSTYLNDTTSTGTLYYQTLSVNGSSLVAIALQKALSVALSVNASSSISLSLQKALHLVMSSNASSAVSLIKQLYETLAVNASSTATLATIKFKAILLSVSGSSTAVIAVTKQFFRNLIVNASSSAVMNYAKTIKQALTANSSSNPILSAITGGVTTLINSAFAVAVDTPVNGYMPDVVDVPGSLFSTFGSGSVTAIAATQNVYITNSFAGMSIATGLRDGIVQASLSIDVTRVTGGAFGMLIGNLPGFYTTGWNGYYIYINPAVNIAYLYKVTNGSSVLEASGTVADYSGTKTFKVQATSDGIRLYVNGVLAVTYLDTTFRNFPYMTAACTVANTQMRFDNFIVTSTILIALKLTLTATANSAKQMLIRRTQAISANASSAVSIAKGIKHDIIANASSNVGIFKRMQKTIAANSASAPQMITLPVKLLAVLTSSSASLAYAAVIRVIHLFKATVKITKTLNKNATVAKILSKASRIAKVIIKDSEI